MPELYVNVDHVATLRQARLTYEPSPVFAASLAELAGAAGIITHLREDRRHIQDYDVRLIKEVISVKFVLEMAPVDAMVNFAKEIKPHQVTLVPERREELTTEGGLNIKKDKDRIRDVIKVLKEAGIEVSLFIEPEEETIKEAAKLNADIVELHTGNYANATSQEDRIRELNKIRRGVEYALSCNLTVAAGHGLTYNNVVPIAKIPGIHELSIGHSIVSRAIFVGMYHAVKNMLDLIK